MVFVENHVAAIVDGTLHDDKDWTNWGDDPSKREDAAITGIWIRHQDEEYARRAREIIANYRAVRRFDEAMTRGVLRRQTVKPRSVDDEPTL